MSKKRIKDREKDRGKRRKDRKNDRANIGINTGKSRATPTPKGKMREKMHGWKQEQSREKERIETGIKIDKKERLYS